MKNILKKLLDVLGIKREILFFYLKLRELWMGIFLKSYEDREKYIQKKFKESVGYKIDFSKEPKTFSEKIQFRKLYDDDPLYSICADKYRVREYVKEKIGEEYLIPLLLVTDKLTKEQWEKLPNQFVAKANHNSGPVQIVKEKNKVDEKKIIKELNYQLKLDYGILSQEKYYSSIPRRIIVEKFLKDNIEDYKFFCFDGEVKYCQLIKDRNIEETIDFYNRDWEKQNFIGIVNSKNPKEKNSLIAEFIPKNYEKMLKIAEKLSKNFDFARVDLYNVEGKIYFGEITFCPASGLGTFIPEEWNYKFGDYWKQKKLK